MKYKITDKITLNNGVQIPQLGLGVYLTKAGEECINAVTWALEAGYRHIDTAMIYENEREVGEAIRRSNISRDEIFVTTKLWNDDHGYDTAMKAFDNSLQRLGLDYIDLYLIHWPGTSKRKESWKALEKIYEAGRCRAIGVSNYMIKHLKELFSYANVVPTINQVEFNPFLYLNELKDYCVKYGIVLEAYSPLARAKKLEDLTVIKMMKKYSKSHSQILIRWAIQQNVVVIPKSAHKFRIIENADVYDFEISNEDMEILNSLDEGFRVSWDPSKID